MLVGLIGGIITFAVTRNFIYAVSIFIGIYAYNHIINE